MSLANRIRDLAIRIAQEVKKKVNAINPTVYGTIFLSSDVAVPYTTGISSNTNMFLTASDELYVEAGYMQMYTEGASIRLEDGGAYIYTALTTGILANSFFLEVGGSMFDIDSYGYFFINGQDSMIISAGSGLNLWGETSMEIGTFGTLNMNASTIETNAIEVINYIDNLISIVDYIDVVSKSVHIEFQSPDAYTCVILNDGLIYLANQRYGEEAYMYIEDGMIELFNTQGVVVAGGPCSMVGGAYIYDWFYTNEYLKTPLTPANLGSGRVVVQQTNGLIKSMTKADFKTWLG